MTGAESDSRESDGAPSRERVEAAVRRGLHLDEAVPIAMAEEGEFANINYVYRIELPDRSLYLKVVPERAKRFPVRLPRARVLSEAKALQRFRDLAGDGILIPEVLFVDVDESAVAMSDVARGRRVLFALLPDGVELLVEQAEALGGALGAIHRGTRGTGPIRPQEEEALVRRVVFDGLLAPGAAQVFPESWDAVRTEMQSHRECLIHADLWSKNLLVQRGTPIALVDFEGVLYGDPAFDLGTLCAVALLPALERADLLPQALTFIARLLPSWSNACGSDEWSGAVHPRTFRATATFLAARGFGPFAYSLSEGARNRLVPLARSLASDTAATIDEFQDRVVRHVGQPPDRGPTSASPV